ncbi:PD-(D/E)XK nuclease family protein [Moheibacter lacus]|uniref:PD-(D/E)XK nuclease family protein n=1 Tax=Moheibacter lacus TaxID=2745851 RepID=A0A838ZFA9_9FLAO|nr:PD-(D/E)XK nuclease family protein [Moheibacter lacus]MBA5628421.1 PD-(D/E)XK nuclease family protein [Moheibacter lacus]
MEKFIDKVVAQLIQNQKSFENTTIILPGNRAILFFRKSFQKNLRNALLPQFVSIDDFISSLSDLQVVSQIQYWFSAYEAYLKIAEKPLLFEEFLKWIPTLQKDFDDIQTSLVDPNQIFDYLVSLERIKKWGQEELEIGSNDLMKNHLQFWEMAKKLFFQLNGDLENKGLGYRGLLYKKAVENLPEFIESQTNELVFVGLNALSNAEKKIVFELEKSGQAKLFWDADRYYLEDSNQEAGYFLRKYKSSLSEWNWEFDHFSQPKNIEVTGIGKRVGQAKYLHQILEKIPEDEYTETAVVLAEETLLPAVLSSVPEKIPKVNITMGFPLNKATMAYFFRSVFELQMNREKLGNGKTYYFKNVLDILDSSILKEKSGAAEKLSLKIRRENYIFSTPKFLKEQLKGSVFSDFFNVPENCSFFVDELQRWIDAQMESADIQVNELDKEYLYRFSLLFAQLKKELNDYPHIQDFKTLYVLYNRLLQNETISFVGEPLEGLQIVGLLETRLLDFKNIILLSANDGILPPGRVENSFIPYDIRQEMGLNTFMENDAVFAYHFYRLMQRAETIQLVYNSEPDVFGSGEKSRFITQMEIESGHEIGHQIALPKFESLDHQELVIHKSEEVQKALENWIEQGISPSSLNSYLRNPIEFYQQKVLNLEEFEEAEETVGARILGNIVHKSLEELYKNLLGKILIPADISPLIKNLEPVVEKYFKDEYKSEDFKRGKNFLVYKIVYSFVENVLKNDLKIAEESELVILSLEEKYEVDFKLETGKIVKLKGYIDRIDAINGQKRVIDYKTGYLNETELKITSEKVPKVFLEGGFSKALQLFLYAQLFFGKHENQYVQFGIYPLKYPKKGVVPLDFEKEAFLDNQILNEIKSPLNNLIEEILNPEIPFVESRESILNDLSESEFQ